MPPYLAEFNDLSHALQLTLRRRDVHLERFTAELNFAHQLRLAHPEFQSEWERCILEAVRTVQARLETGQTDFETLLALGEALLEPIGRVAKEYTLLCVSHAHIDMNWMWSWPETVSVVNDTFQTMLGLMDEFPGFIYSQSQASTYRLIEKYHPALFEAIRARVREGRWEVTASQWVEGDKNMASGESISRHLLYTRAYFEEKFGLTPEDVQVDFEPDTFGHPATLPTILVRGGVKYFYHCRGSIGPHLYWWIGPDGSRVLAFNDVMWYMTTVTPHIVDPLVSFTRATGMKSLPVLYGVGNHGGGPTRRDLQRLIEMNTWPIFPRVEFSTLHRFFREAEVTAQNIPEVLGERNFVFTGCYTSQARHKWANRHGENLLFTAETAAVLGERIAGVPYPCQNLEEAWRALLFTQFHDILPGSGTRETRHYALGRAQEVQAAAGMARTNALRALSRRVNTQLLRDAFPIPPQREERDAQEAALAYGAGVGYGAGTGGESAYSAASSRERVFLVFNPLPYPRREVIEVQLWDPDLDERYLVATSEGDLPPRPVQVLERGNYWGHQYLKVAFPVEVPACGYRAVCVSDRLAEFGLAQEQPPDLWGRFDLAWRQILPPDHTLENEYLRVELHPPSGGITRLLDKRAGREWVLPGKRLGVLEYCVEQNIGMTAWVIGPFLTREELCDGGSLRRVHSGPYIHAFRWTRRLHDTQLELDITLRQNTPRVEFRLRVDWREIGHAERGIPHLRVCFPLAIEQAQPRYEIPFGAIRRDLFDGEEVVALRWVDLSTPNGTGVTLVNSSKYGFGLEKDTLHMTLLRASIDPDPLPDLGEHLIEYALIPHGPGWGIGDAMQAGEEFNIPLVVTSCDFHNGDLPTSASFLSIANPNVRLAALKKGQDGRSLVLRLVEVEGRETEAQLTFSPLLLSKGMRAVAVDTLERPVENVARLEGERLHVALPAFGIVTVRIS